jgi:hypothetical protein
VQDDMRAAPTPSSAEGGGDGIRELLILLEELKKDVDRYMRIAAAAEDGRHLDAAQGLRRAPNLSSRLVQALTTAAGAVQALPLESNVRDAARRARLHYRETLERHLDEAALARSGQWPSYVIADVLRLQFDLERGEVALNAKGLETLDPARVVEHIKARLAELFDKSLDASEFLSLLKAAHDQVTAAHGRGMGDYANIREVFAAVRTAIEGSGRDRRYTEAKFGADLYRLQRDGRATTPDGLLLELSPAQNAAGGLYVPAKGGGNYIAALRFASRPTNG